MHDNERKYAFSWDVVAGGDLADSRPNLGAHTTIEVYRLLQFTLRDVLERHYGTEAADELFREAGVVAGRAFFDRYCASAGGDLPAMAKVVQDKFKELGMGLVRFEVVDPEHGRFQLTVDEDLDCSGLPDTSDQICVYDEGFIKGVFDAFTGADFDVREVDCWCSGERTCRFVAQRR